MIQIGTVFTEVGVAHESEIALISEARVRVGQVARCPVVVTDDEEETVVIELPELESARSITPDTPLLCHLAALTCKPYCVEFVGTARRIESGVGLRLNVLLPPHLIDGSAFARRPCTAAAQLFLHMVPLPEAPGAQFQAELDPEPAETRGLSGIEALRVAAGAPAGPPPAGPELVSLASAVMAVPAKAGAAWLPPIVATPAAVSAAATSTVAAGEDPAPKYLQDVGVTRDFSRGATFADIPTEEIVRAMTFLDSRDVRALACTCRALRELARDVGPGLHLELFPHQRAAVRWMLQREEHPGRLPHPTLRRFTFSAELEAGGQAAIHLWGNTATGEALDEAPEPLKDFRGGLFCDEPGLGKTVTSLALILRSRGTVPAAPPGAEGLTWFRVEGAGTHANAARAELLGFYEVKKREEGDAAAGGGAGIKRRRSGRIRNELPEDWGQPNGSSVLGGPISIPSEAPASEGRRLGRPRAGAAAPAAAAVPAGAPPAAPPVAAPEPAAPAAPAPVPVPAGARSAQALARLQVLKQQVRVLAAVPIEEEEEEKDEEEEEDVAAGPSAMEVEVGAAAAATPAKRQRLDAAGASAPSSSSGGGGSPDLNTPPLPRPQRPAAAPAASPSPAPASGLRVNRALALGSPNAGSDEDDGPGSDYAPSDDSSTDGEGFYAPARRRTFKGDTGRKDRGADPFSALYDTYFDDDDEEELYDDDGGWLQCDVCARWRRVSAAAHPPDDAPWCCYQHPTAGWRSCTIGCDGVGAGEAVLDSPGWLGPGDALCAPKNVQFFRETMAKHGFERFLVTCTGGYYKGPAAWIKWMAEGDPASFGAPEGVAISDRALEGYGAFLADVGFVPAAAKACLGLGPRSGGAQRKVGTLKGQAPGRQDWLRWRAPDSHARLTLDQAALRAALQLGPPEPRRRVYLSPATLVVVPSELVAHWVDQIQRHTRPGALRVGVYAPADNELSTFRRPPPPHVLAWEHDVVITTFSKLSSDWRAKDPVGCSPLMQVHWLRVILDEGHTVGSMSITNKLQMTTALRAERRWCMTGTPAPNGRGGDAGGAGAITFRYLQPLLHFLHDPALGGAAAFKEAAERQLGDAPAACRWRLQAALRRAMIRASKADLGGMPKLVRRVEALAFAPSHARSYNEFVDLVRLNLLTSDWFDPDHGESLLAAGNARLAAQYLDNLRASCNIAGNIALAVRNDDLLATLDLVAAKNGVPARFEPEPPFCRAGEHPLAGVEAALRRGGACQRCGAAVRIMLVTPCAHMLCVHCTAQDKAACPACAAPYVMQAVNDPGRRRDAQGYVNPAPKWPVPKELIEFQPAFAQAGAVGAAEGFWQGDWEHTDSTKAAHLVEQLRRLGVLPPVRWAPRGLGDWGEGAGAAPAWPALTPAGVPAKAIVFSQFKLHYELLYKRLLHAVGGNKEIIESFQKGMTGAEKRAAEERFRKNPRCTVLVIDESGAEGLDLSFVQHVFLAEPIPNRSLELQVVSRAHRMGAREDVTVHVLAMRGTLEEEILRRSGDWADAEGAGEEAHVYDGAGEAAEGEAAAAGGGAGAGGEREQEAARRMDRNAYLKALKPVRVEEGG